MKLIKQTIAGQGRGNCFGACIASLLEVDIDEIPSLTKDQHIDWVNIMNRYLATKGYYMVHKKPDGNFEFELEGPVIGVVPSTNFEDQLHAVIWYDGTIIWDPTTCGRNYIGHVFMPQLFWLILPLFGAIPETSID